MTLVLSEKDVRGLIGARDAVSAVEECFRQQALSRADNSPRTRSRAPGSVMNVMHASLPYLGRAGVKCYLSSRRGTRFVFVLFGLDEGGPLAVMGADTLGRYRTGAASAVATKYLFAPKDFRLSVCGSGRQALTQVLAMSEVASLKAVNIWSPNAERRASFARELGRLGFGARAANSLEESLESSEVATAITSSKEPFLTARALRNTTHVNLCGSNSPDRAEATPEAVGEFGTVVVDDVVQSKIESGDLIMAERRGFFSWDRATELKDAVSGRLRPSGRTLFKSNGVAIEDVAVASLLYDKAIRSGEYSNRQIELGTV